MFFPFLVYSDKKCLKFKKAAKKRIPHNIIAMSKTNKQSMDTQNNTEKAKQLKKTNEEFLEKAKKAFRDLLDRARDINELHFAFALSPEFRPYQDPGWNTAYEAQLAFKQYVDFLASGNFPELRPRVMLALYCHLAEASGYWEITKNMLSIVNGEFYDLQPFREFVRKHRQSGALIYPNANKLMQSIAGFAKNKGFNKLAEVFIEAYMPDLRNGYAHSDYLLASDGVWLHNRYEKPYCIPWLEFNYFMEKGINFYATWSESVHEYIISYESEKTVQGRINPEEPLGEWTIHYVNDKKTLTISGHVLT